MGARFSLALYAPVGTICVRKSIIWARHPIVKLRSGCKCIVLMMLWHEPSGLRCKLHRWFTNLLLIIFVCVGFLTPKYVFS